MKRWLAVLMACVMVMSAVAAVAEVDLSGYSTEELYALEKQVGQEILNRVMPDGVFYEDDEVSIQWIGLVEELSMYYAPNMLITNKSDHNMYFGVSTVAFNGVKGSVYTSLHSPELESGLSILTASSGVCLLQKEGFADVGINSVEDINTVYIVIQFYDSNEYGRKVIKEVKQTIPIVK